VGCPCALGEIEADNGWCSGALAFNIKSGKIDGTDVSGAKVVFIADWPQGFLGGNGVGRMYFDQALSEKQRDLLGEVLGGKRGGVFGMIATLITSVLPSKEAAIDVQVNGDETTITCGNFGKLQVKPLRGANGQPTRLLNAAASFREDVTLGKGTGSHWQDPDLKKWQSGGHAELSEFDWSP
jgi:hypothetical protein